MSINEEINRIVCQYYNEKSTKYTTKDFSKGCDNLVYLISVKNESSIILRIPKKSQETRPPQHSPKHLKWTLEKCTSAGVKVPRHLDSTESYYIEEYISGFDVSEVSKELSKQEILEIYQQVGAELKKIHSIQTTKYSYMSSIPGIGNSENLFNSIETDVLENSKTVFTKNNGILNETQMILFPKILQKYKKYLMEFSDPRLVHCDITNNNLRVEKINGKFFLKAIIDFSDCCSTDPLMDLGEIFEEFNCDWEFISAIEIGYGKIFTSFEKEIIVFYAMTYSIWLEHKENIEYCLNYLK
eukprot:gene10220-2640_t